MFTFYPEELEYIYQPNTFYPRSRFSRCRCHNQPPCSYHSNPYSSYSHPCSDSYFSPSHNNRSYNGNNNQSPYHHINSNHHDKHDDPIFLNNSRQRDSFFGPENVFNVQPNYIDLERMNQRPQGHKFKNYGEESRKKATRKSRSVPIATPSDSIKVNDSKTMLDKKQASKKIYRFLRYYTANYKTRRVLTKLLQLRNIQNRLSNLVSQNDRLTLTFSTDQVTPQVLPTSKNNKKFLEYEDAVLKILSKLDEIDSNGYDIVRERRREVVGLAQKILNRLDEEKEKQWEEFKMLRGKGEDINKSVIKKNVMVENDDLENNTVVEKNEMVDNSMDKIASEEVEVTDIQNYITQSPAIVALEGLEDVKVKPYNISHVDDGKETDDSTKDAGIMNVNSFASVNVSEDMDVDEDTKSESSSSVDQKKKTNDEFVIIDTDDFN